MNSMDWAGCPPHMNAVGLCCNPGSAQLTSALTDLPVSLADFNINLWVLVDKFRSGCDLDSRRKIGKV